MYNIHNHYQNVFQYIKSKKYKTKLCYFFPFGSTKFQNLEQLDCSGDKDFLIFCFDQEPFNYIYNLETFEEFDKTTYYNERSFDAPSTTIFSQILQETIEIDTKKILFSMPRPTILLNTEKDSEIKNKFLKKFNYIDCYYFFHALAAADWFRGYQYSYNITPIKQRKITKKFISFNRITGSSRIYRAFFVNMLYEKNLLDKGYISFSKICPVHGNIIPSALTALSNYQIDNFFINRFLKNIKLIPDLRIDTPENSVISNDSFQIGGIEQAMQSFVHVVTETCFWESKKHLTEKIFKPIVLKQPFVLLGCANNLSYFKEYGFKTFDRWWDESYDKCEDPLQRIGMVVKILENLSKLSNQQLQAMLIEMEEVLEYNYALFYSKQFIKSIWGELKTNLDSAIAQAEILTTYEDLNQDYLPRLQYAQTDRR